MTSIYCYGDITYEQHIHLEEYGNSNDTLVKSVKFKVGGSAFNTASALANIGNKVNLICSLGKDIEGEYLKKILYKNVFLRDYRLLRGTLKKNWFNFLKSHLIMLFLVKHCKHFFILKKY